MFRVSWIEAVPAILVSTLLGIVQDPKPEGTPTLEGANVASWMGEVKVVGSPQGSAIVWDVVPEDNVSVRIIKVEKTVLFAGPRGTYTVKCRVVKGEDVIADLRKSVLLTGGDQPLPPVPPDPPVPPVPPPVPGGKVAKFVVVEDTAKASQWRGDVLSSPKVQAYYRANELAHLIIPVKAEIDGPAPPEVQTYLKLATGKELPYLWALDKDAKLVKEGKVPTTPDTFIEFFEGGPAIKRAMGNIPPPEGKLKAKWKVFGESANVPLIPRADWKTTDLSAFLPPVHDQDGRGQCNASATCTAVEACRKVAGLPYVFLSAGDLYSQINGGRDDGSLLEDSLQAMLNNGVASSASVPYVWDGRNHGNQAPVKAERPNYRVLEAYTCPNFDAMASALQQGFFLVEGLVWYDNDDPDRDGWIPTVGRGGAGGHALCGYGLAKKSDGSWGIRTRNSWGPGWGVGGNCVVPEKRFDNRIGGYWCVRSVVFTPINFPVPKLAVNRIDPFGKMNDMVLKP